MTTDPTTYSQIQVPSSQPTSAQPTPLTRRQEHEHLERSPTNNIQTAALPLSSSAIPNNSAAQISVKMMLTTYPQLPTQYSHSIASSNSSNASKDDIPAPRATLDLPTINAPSSSSDRLTLPKPPTSRLPVRMGLSDPRVHNYLSPSRYAALPSHGPSSTSTATAPATSTTPSRTSMSRQDPPPMRNDAQSKLGHTAAVAPVTGLSRLTETSQLRVHPYRAQQSSTAPPPSRQNIGGSMIPLVQRTSEDLRPRPAGVHQHAHPSGIDRYHPVHSTESHIATPRIHSRSPGHLPSPSPSVPSSSPESTLMAPETVWIGPTKHWSPLSFDTPANPHMPYQFRYEYQQERLGQKEHSEMSSPPTSEGDLCMDSRTLPPLFPPYNAGSQGSQVPPAPLAPRVTQTPTLTAPGPVKMMTSLSASSNTSSGSSATSVNSFNPMTDSRAISPPLSSVPMSSKLHHPRIPIRSPERDGHDLMMTSTIDTNSSEYLNMDYYNIYRQNPLLLRPEGGRYDERRVQATQTVEDSSHQSSHQQQHVIAGLKGKSKAISGSDPVKISRKHPISLQSTGTHRVLRHEATPEDNFGFSEGSSTRASSRMSISNLLTSDDDMVHSSNHLYEASGEPTKTRLSKKRARLLGMIDQDGNIRGRKRRKKVHDPEQLSPAGFRHGGERTVREPDELIVLDPSIGPTGILDTISPPTVVWKGKLTL